MSINAKSNNSTKTLAETNQLPGVQTKTLTNTYNGSTITIYLYKYGSVVTATIYWIGKVANGDGNKYLWFSNIPAGWRPGFKVRFSAEHIAGTTIMNAQCCTIYTIGTDGGVGVITNGGDMLERIASASWIAMN